MKKIRIIAILSAFLMFAALFLLLNSVRNKDSEQEQSIAERVQPITVVKAKKNIAPYSVITEDMVEVKEMYAEKAFDDYFSDIKDVVGSVAMTDLFKGETISQKRIVKEMTGIGLAYNVEMGKRAVTIPVGIPSGVSNTLKVGNYVDVIVTINDLQNTNETEEEKEGEVQYSAAQLLDQIMNEKSPANSQVYHQNWNTTFSYVAFQKMKILSLDDRFFRSASDPVTGNSYGSVTLEATPAQAVQIVLLRNTTSIDLILRNQMDEEIVNEPRGEIFQNYQANPEQ